MFEKLVSVLSPSAGDLRDTIDWTRRLFEDQGITLSDIPLDREVESALVDLQMESFTKADGSVETFSKLQSSEGALFAKTSEGNPSTVGLKWKTKPGKPTDVAHWLLELVPPADLRDDEASSILEMKIKGTRTSCCA